MENRTSGEVLGHAADVWGQRAMSSCPAATAMILPIANDLGLRKGLGVTVDSFLSSAPSLRRERRTQFRHTRVSARRGSPARVGAASTRWIRSAGSARMRLHSTARQGESKFIYDHVAGADKHGGVADRRDWNCNGDRQAGPNRLWGVWRRPVGPAPQPGLSTGRELHWHLG